MLSPRMAKVMLDKYRKEHPVGIADSSRFAKFLEPKFGWGHEAWVEDLASTVEKMEFAPEWTPKEVKNYIAKFVRSCKHSTPSITLHERS